MGYNNPQVKTPNLDRLAARGLIFDRAYCPNPTCTPTRASIITGMYPSQHGAWSLGTKLPEEVPTVGDKLIEIGYRTALVGKAHFQPLASTEEYPSLEAYPKLQDLDFWRTFQERFYGFDHVELARNHTDEAHVGQHYALWMEAKGCKNWRDYFCKPTGNADRQQHVWQIPEEYHYDTWISERTNQLLETYKQNDENFFLWSSYFDPHPSYLVPEPWASMYDPKDIEVPHVIPGEHANNPPHFQMTQELSPDFSSYQEKDGSWCHGFSSHRNAQKSLAQDIAIYYGMISMMDHYIGKTLDKLDELGLTKDTLVVFTTDHGHFFGQHGLCAKGAFHYEDMIKVPFIASLPGVIPEGKRSNAMLSLVDLAPTFLDYAEALIPRSMTGISQKSVFENLQPSVRNHVIVENRHQPTKVFHKTYIDDRYKITIYYNQNYGELFDLQTDPGEINNRWNDSAYQELKCQLLLKYAHAQLGIEPIWMPRIAGA
jgi:arylsulfatase A-like enzyme